MDGFVSPILIPVVAVGGGLLIPIVAIISNSLGESQARRVKADQRMAMLARGVNLDDIERVLNNPNEARREPVTIKDPGRSMANARRAGIVLTSLGLGLIIFGAVLAWIVATREVLAVAAAGLIPLAIGIGFFIDYSLQQREMARFGLELEPSPGTHR
jgi:hypothetical protein